jgi:glucose/arabinose dehydrogenase
MKTASRRQVQRAHRPRTRKQAVELELLEPRVLLAINPPAVGGDPSVNPTDFRVTVYARGLDYPTAVLAEPDGSLLAVLNQPNPGFRDFYSTTAQIVRFVDPMGQGVADGSPTVLAAGLPGADAAITQAGPYIITSSSFGTISFLQVGATPDSPLTPAGTIQLAFPANWDHTTFSLVSRPAPGEPGDYNVFFNVGSEFNGIKQDAQGNILFDSHGRAIPDPTVDPVPATGLLTATLQGDGIYMVTLHDSYGTPVLSGLTRIATGLRNAASMAIDPATRDLVFADNGIDGTDGGNEAYSTDTLHRIAAADIGKSVPNYGFPYTYTLTNLLPGQPNIVVNPSPLVVPPLIAFQPLADPNLPLTGSESEGASGFAIAPRMFPAPLNQGVFIGFHGLFDTGGTANEENPMLFADPTSGKYFDFISNDEPQIGHLDGATSTADSLFVTDIASNGHVFSNPGSGVIYQIEAINHAPSVGAIGNQSVNEGQLLEFGVTATDPDPGQTLTYSLGPGAPAGASINPATGVFMWTPPAGPATALITVIATDNGSPPLSGSASFTVTVNDLPPTVFLTPAKSPAPVGKFADVGWFTDPGNESWNATVNYGDRSKTVKLSLRPDKTFSLAHRYVRRGSYTITVRVIDADGSVGTQTLSIVIGRKRPSGKPKR